MSKFEKIRTPEEKQFEKFANNYLEALRDENIPDIYKLLLRQKDVLLVLGRLKPMTNIDFNHEILEGWKKKKILQTQNFETFKKYLHQKFGIFSTDDEKGPDVIGFKIFDPRQIKEEISQFKELKNWPRNNSLKIWIENNLHVGVNRDLIYGALYGFPRSAIDFMVKVGYLGKVRHKTISSNGENYGVPVGGLEIDVKLREKRKNVFFQMLNNNKEIQDEFKNTNKLKHEVIKIKKQIIKKHEEKKSKE